MKTEIGKITGKDGPNRLIIEADMRPLTGERIQPASFADINHAIYDTDKCVIDSEASMANHLEAVCKNGPGLGPSSLVPELKGLPHLVSRSVNPETGEEIVITDSLSEGHRFASSYFVDAKMGDDSTFLAAFMNEVGSVMAETSPGKSKKNKKTKSKSRPYLSKDAMYKVYKYVATRDPNSLVHGFVLMNENIRLPRLLTATLDSYGTKEAMVGGVHFDHLGKTRSGTVPFTRTDLLADSIKARFVIDLSLLRSYGNGSDGLSNDEKELVFGLALWKVFRLLSSPFRFRTRCDLVCSDMVIRDENGAEYEKTNIDMGKLLEKSGGEATVLDYPWDEWAKAASSRSEEADE